VRVADTKPTETGVAGLTVSIGTVDASGTTGSYTFTPISGATATTGSNGTFSITLPAGTSITGNTVVVAYSGTAPTTLPAAGVLVSPVFNGPILCDPATTAATTYLCSQAASNNVPLNNINPQLLPGFLQAAENAASAANIPSGSTLPQMEQILLTQISSDPTTGITVNGIVVSGENHGTPSPANGTLTSGAAFTTGQDSSGSSYNGTSSTFTASNVLVTRPLAGNVHVTGIERPTSTTPLRTFDIVIPTTTPLAPGTYTATIHYSEVPAPATVSTSTSTNAFGPGGQFFGGPPMLAWSATSVGVTIVAGSSSGALDGISVNLATYSPLPGPFDTTAVKGTLATGLTGTVSIP
jgi:hypothetical protein